MFRRRTTGSENGNAHAPAVAPIGRGEQRIKRAVTDDIDAAVRIDLDMIVGEELPVVPRRPVEVDLRLTRALRGGIIEGGAVCRGKGF